MLLIDAIRSAVLSTWAFLTTPPGLLVLAVVFVLVLIAVTVALVIGERHRRAAEHAERAQAADRAPTGCDDIPTPRPHHD